MTTRQLRLYPLSPQRKVDGSVAAAAEEAVVEVDQRDSSSVGRGGDADRGKGRARRRCQWG